MELSVATFMKINAPSYHLRFRSVFNLLEQKGKISYREIIKTLLGKYRRISLKKKTDIIFIARVTNIDFLKKIFDHVSHNNIPVIYDTDDLLLYDRRKDGPVKEHGILSEYLAKASCVIASTAYLADELRRYNRTVFLFPNLLDPNIWEMDKKDRRGHTGPLNICCIGTGVMPENLKFIIPAMEYCMKAYGSDVVFHLWGNNKYIEEKVRDLRNVRLIDGKVPYMKFARQLQESGHNMAVVPLNDSHFNRAKSSIKYLEYAISDIPAIYSKVEPYRNLPDGQSCVLVDNDPEVWRSKIINMIENEEERRHLSAQARDDVLKNHILNEAWADVYLSILQKIYDN